MSAPAPNGFTLIETIIMISIITILTSLTVGAFPIARARQRIIADSSAIQLWLREAERRAHNETRTEDCLNQAGSDPEVQKRCSDVGLALRGQEAHIFADLDGNRNYSPDDDFIYSQNSLEAELDNADAWQAFVFTATPPNLTMHYNGQVVRPNTAITLTLTSGSQQQQLPIYPYRHLDANAQANPS